MSHRIGCVVLGSALAMLTVSCGSHAVVRAGEGPEISNYDVQVEGQSVRVRDSEGVLLMDTRGMPAYRNARRVRGVRTQTLVMAVENGFDVVYEIRNTSSRPADVGSLTTGVFTLGENVTWRDFVSDGHAEAASFREQPASQEMMYPGKMYSPVAVLSNGTSTVGVSLLYPVLEYQHDVQVRITSPSERGSSRDEGGRGWAVEFRMSEVEPRSGVIHPGKLGPREVREYRVCVRFADGDESWLKTLAPYHAYFQSMYGGVQYERDARPVLGYMLALPGKTSRRNPYGFIDERTRPDRYGFGRVSARINQNKRRWGRVMVWTPSGVNRVHKELNFPSKFTDFWMEGSVYGHRMGDAVEKFRRVKTTGFDLGFWWGRSLQVSKVWDSGETERFDPENEEHVRLAFEQLDIAEAAGATMIGLDAFATRWEPVWKVLPWLKRMQERYPEMRFVSEGRCSDILHAQAPTYIDAYKSVTSRRGSERDSTAYKFVQSPLYLADYLLPGHETWCGLMYSRPKAYIGRSLSVSEKVAEAERVAGMGYVPVVFMDLASVSSLNASESWHDTVREGDRSDSQGEEQTGLFELESLTVQQNQDAPRHTFDRRRGRRAPAFRRVPATPGRSSRRAPATPEEVEQKRRADEGGGS